jgi:hypothetical protein
MSLEIMPLSSLNLGRSLSGKIVTGGSRHGN